MSSLHVLQGIAATACQTDVISMTYGSRRWTLVQANGVPVNAAAQGLKLCIDNLRLRCPQSQIVLVKILPAFDPGKEVGAKVREINVALDELKFNTDEKVRGVDLWNDFTNADGTLKTSLYSDGHLHLSVEGYEIFAARLSSLVNVR